MEFAETPVTISKSEEWRKYLWDKELRKDLFSGWRNTMRAGRIRNCGLAESGASLHPRFDTILSTT
jgi:hypothetical protein